MGDLAALKGRILAGQVVGLQKDIRVSVHLFSLIKYTIVHVMHP